MSISWRNQLTENFRFRSTTTDRSLERLFCDFIVVADDERIEDIEDFIDSFRNDEHYATIMYKGNYLYAQWSERTSNMEWTQVIGYNLNTCNIFNGKKDVHLIGTSQYWSLLFPHLKQSFDKVKRKLEDDENCFVKQGNSFVCHTWSSFGSPAWYTIDAMTGEIDYDYIAD